MTSWPASVVVDALSAVGIAAFVCGVAGLGDDNGDAVTLAGIGLVCAVAAFTVRRWVKRPERPSAGEVFLGIGVLWTVLVLAGAAVYLATGAFGRVDDALVEAAAGFTTTALTMLEAGEASRAMLLWRAATSWIGGLVAILIAVVALPSVLASTDLIGYSVGRRGFDLVPSVTSGRRRVLALYGGFTAACVAAYAAVGLSPLDAVVIGLGTVSTGGFTAQPDSLAGYGSGVHAVATAGMLLAGMGIFVLWWLARLRLRRAWRSQELRVFAAIVVLATAVVALGDDAAVADAIFAAASLASTTGFASSDWTLWGASAAAVLLVAAGIGTMMGSPGGGVRVMRVRLLWLSAGGELRRQLDPRSVVVVRRDREPLSATTMERLRGHLIAHMGLIVAGMLLLAVAGLSLQGSIWAAVSAIATAGPAAGEVGAFGQIEHLPRPARLALVPLMMAGRMSIPPLLAGIGLALQMPRASGRRMRILGRGFVRRVDRQVPAGAVDEC